MNERDNVKNATKDRSYMLRRLSDGEIPCALSLAWAVFCEFESPFYTSEGTKEFYNSIHDSRYLAGIDYYGAFDETELIGIACIRPENNHICLFFVDGRYHRRGIGTMLFQSLLSDRPGQRITLNSSPYGVPFYRALGFKETSEEQTVNGIRFTPMEYIG